MEMQLLLVQIHAYFKNNVFNANYTFPVGTNIGNGNYVNVSHTGFFVNESNISFAYTDNFHLSNPSTYLGNDGTEAGMYGGSYPYKEGRSKKSAHHNKNYCSTNNHIR